MASIRQTFLDILYLGDNKYNLITSDALSWVSCNLNSGKRPPRGEITITGDSTKLMQLMTMEGIIVRPRFR